LSDWQLASTQTWFAAQVTPQAPQFPFTLASVSQPELASQST